MWINFGKRKMRKGVGIDDRENNKVFERQGVSLRGGVRLSLYVKTGRLVERVKKRNKRKSKGKRGKAPGELVRIDSIVYFLNGIKRYIIAGIDTHRRFGLAYGYSNLLRGVRGIL
ncbi:MAG: hypothetical protein RMI74_06390 [Thermodesulfobacterium sp.]|nr:hypothetical protein [Thermodesulfobacterium sp.]